MLSSSIKIKHNEAAGSNSEAKPAATRSLYQGDVVRGGVKVLSRGGHLSGPCPSLPTEWLQHPSGNLPAHRWGPAQPRAAGRPGTAFSAVVFRQRWSQAVLTAGRFPWEDSTHFHFSVQRLRGSNIYAAWLHVKMGKRGKKWGRGVTTSSTDIAAGCWCPGSLAGLARGQISPTPDVKAGNAHTARLLPSPLIHNSNSGPTAWLRGDELVFQSRHPQKPEKFP